MCAESWVLGKIASRFRHQVLNVPNLPNVQITDFQDIHSVATCPPRKTSRSGGAIAAQP